MESSSPQNEEEVIELGDEITIVNDKYGAVRGRVYYRGDELVSIMPDGVSDRVYEFPLEDGEFADELSVSEVKIHKKRIEEGFVRLHDLRVSQLMETFGRNGEKGAAFTIRAVNEDDDMIEVTDSEGATLSVNFDYTGIPRDMPFVVIRNREAPVPVTDEVVDEEEVADEAARSRPRTPMPEVGEIGDEAMAEEEASEPEDDEFELEVVGVITLPVQIEVEEIPAAERMYPESVQKADALNDFITRLTTLSQKDPRILRDIRILVEKMNQLRQDVMTNPSTSYDTLAELMKNVHVPIGRPVLDVDAKFYATEEGAEGVNQAEEAAAAAATIDDKGTGNFWINMLSYMNKYAQPWYSSEKGDWDAMKDSEFFRGGIPDMETQAIKGYTSGLEMGQLGMSLGRALGPFYYSDSKKRQKIAFPGESAPLMNYVLFPLKEAASFGTTRTGQLAIDMNNSMAQPRWTKQAIEAAGGIDEVATGNGFVVLGIKGNTLGNIPLADYFNALEIGGRGFEDFIAIMSQLGLMDKEVSKDVGDVLGGKLDNTRKKLIEHIRTLREKLAASEENFDVITGQADELIDGLVAAEGDPVLLDIMNKIRKGAPVIGKSGLVLLSALLKEEPDLFMAKAGGRADILARHQLTARRKQYGRTLTVTKRMREYEETKGEKPIPNSCKHVGLMRDIKRIDDLSTRFLHMINFVRNYQGERDMNWINCNVCSQHLICIHEMLQMQQYLHPNEKEVLQKELVLNFSGPIVGGEYQCRNCGQGIADIDYEKGMQFDDEGRPLNGRGEVIDEDALKKEEIEYIVSGPIGSNDKLVEGAFTPETEEDELIYLTIKEVCDRIGIFPDKSGYTNMMNATKTYMARQRTREEYVAAQKARSKITGAAAVALDYDIYIKRILVGCIAAAILIEVQTKIPDYVVRYTLPGCMNPGFFGMPLGADTDKTGIQYVGCAVASIMKNESPWNMTGFQKERNDVKRQQIVAKYVEAIIKDMAGDAMVQYNISAKKLYLKKTFGSEGVGAGADVRQKDAIISRFLPRMYMISKEEAADAPIIPEVIRDERQLADLWIRMGHRMARKTAFLVRGSPFSETTCCVSEIRRPTVFWDAISDLPKFEPRMLRSVTGGTRFMVPFSPRKLSDMLVAPKAEFYHRVFLKVCFRGPRMGLPHEPGLTLKCPWCDFKFPSHPRLLNYDGEGKSALAEQGVEITEQTFTAVLDASHKTTTVPPYVVGKVEGSIEILAELGAIIPAPSAVWKENVEDLVAGVKSLTTDATDVDIALAMATFSDVAATSEKVIRGRLSGLSTIIENIHSLSGKNLQAVLYSYFLVPFQRLITRLDPEAHLQIWNDYELSDKHIADIRNTIILPNESLQKKFLPVFKSPKASFANAKLRYYVKQLAAALARTDKLGSLTVVGRDDIYRHIMHYILYVPLATLLNSNEIPPEEYDTSVTSTIIDSSIRLLMDIVAHTLGKYKDERLVYSDNDLKERIQISNEKEAMHVLSIFDEMSDEMREIELMKKKYGIGRWAVGGTSLIYAYDPDRYDAEREERIMAGIVDMSEPGPEGMAPEGRAMDIYGFVMETGGEEDDRIDLGGDYEDNF